jgi:RHS repeat-associated protein
VKRLLVLLALLVPTVAHAQTVPETIEYYGTDTIGSIRIVFAVDGTVLGRQDYAPFGKPLFTVPAMPKEGFGGNEKDDETDQGNFHVRMFQARTGRFTQTDPIFDGIFDPQRWNRYVYVRNSALNLTDPNGDDPPACPPGSYYCKTDTCPPGRICRTVTENYLPPQPFAPPFPNPQNPFMPPMGMFSSLWSFGGAMTTSTSTITTTTTTTTPTTTNSGTKTRGHSDDPNVAIEVLKGCGQGLAAAIDGSIPFFDPLEAFGAYDESTPGIQFSRTVGGTSLSVVEGFGFARGLAWLTEGAAQGSLLYRVSHNPKLRIGYGRRAGNPSVPRIAIGGGEKRIHLDLDIFCKRK